MGTLSIRLPTTVGTAVIACGPRPAVHSGARICAPATISSKTWTNPLEATIRFPPESGLSLKNIWKIALGPAEAPDKLYCGVEPAALFESQDAGESWSLVRGLFDHPHRPRWMSGLGGLCLHTILPHPTNPGR